MSDDGVGPRFAGPSLYDPLSRQAVLSGGDGVITGMELGRWLDRRDGA